MDWISSFLGFLLEQFVNVTHVVEQYLDLPVVVLVCAALLFFVSLTLAYSRR